jgi:hypothetical protein
MPRLAETIAPRCGWHKAIPKAREGCSRHRRLRRGVPRRTRNPGGSHAKRPGYYFAQKGVAPYALPSPVSGPPPSPPLAGRRWLRPACVGILPAIPRIPYISHGKTNSQRKGEGEAAFSERPALRYRRGGAPDGTGLKSRSLSTMFPGKSRITSTDFPSFIALPRQTPLRSFCKSDTFENPCSSIRAFAWSRVKLWTSASGFDEAGGDSSAGTAE